MGDFNVNCEGGGASDSFDTEDHQKSCGFQDDNSLKVGDSQFQLLLVFPEECQCSRTPPSSHLPQSCYGLVETIT